ncbi:MAG: hypothetical protein KF690_06575 [Bacteroidetes bacterium]|nr:hypothetical protein [Bacteroidota bacterium]
MSLVSSPFLQLSQAGAVCLDKVQYVKGLQLFLNGAPPVTLTAEETAWFRDPAHCINTGQLAAAEKTWQQAKREYNRAVSTVDAHNTHLAELHQLREQAHSLGLTDEHARIYEKLRAAGAPREYPRPPHPPVVSMADKTFLCVEEYVLTRRIARFQYKDGRAQLFYPGHSQPLVLKQAALVEAFLLGDLTKPHPAAPDVANHLPDTTEGHTLKDTGTLRQRLMELGI